MSAELKRCAQCGAPCDDLFGCGDEHHCSYACHDARMRTLARENMTEKERSLFGWLAQFASRNYPVTALAVAGEK